MSTAGIGRRQFLTLALGLVLAPAPAASAPAPRSSDYLVEAEILYGLLSFRLQGRIQEWFDRPAGRYRVVAAGQGDSIANHVESEGVLHDGRWAPLRSASLFEVHGRQSRTAIDYDYPGRAVRYRARGETFFRRRLRVVDDRMALPGGHVDDAVTALLNYRDGLWRPGPDGRLRTRVIRRRRSEDEGPDEVAAVYRAEAVPLELVIERDARTGKRTALFDLSGFSSWARGSKPARIDFGQDSRPERISSSMILGTSVTIRIG